MAATASPSEEYGPRHPSSTDSATVAFLLHAVREGMHAPAARRNHGDRADADEVGRGDGKGAPNVFLHENVMAGGFPFPDQAGTPFGRAAGGRPRSRRTARRPGGGVLRGRRRPGGPPSAVDLTGSLGIAYAGPFERGWRKDGAPWPWPRRFPEGGDPASAPKPSARVPIRPSSDPRPGPIPAPRRARQHRLHL